MGRLKKRKKKKLCGFPIQGFFDVKRRCAEHNISFFDLPSPKLFITTSHYPLHQRLAEAGIFSHLMPIDELVRRRARRLPQRDPLRPAARCTMCGLGALAPALAEQQDAAVDPPEAQADDARDQEARGREQHPVFAHPEDQAGVFTVPAAAPVPPEERPWLFVVLVRHQHPYSPCLAAIPAACTCSDND